jgi:hypothetical protein
MKLDNKPQRAWVNQPSTLQPCYAWNGARVLAIADGAGLARIYFTSGTIVSARVLTNVLSPGWPPDEDAKDAKDGTSRICNTCKHADVRGSELPCRSCIHASSLVYWEPKP